MRFYVLMPEDGHIIGGRWAEASPVDPQYGEAERCPQCGRFISGLEWLPPRLIQLSSPDPSTWDDFVWGAGVELLVSARFVQAYQAAGLKGVYEFAPVELVEVDEETKSLAPAGLLPYYEIHKIERLGPALDEVASKVRRAFPETRCSFCRFGKGKRSFEGMVIDMSTWQGEDMFVPRGGTGIVVSERVREIVERLQVRNVWLIPSENFGWDEERPMLWYVNGGPELERFKAVFADYCGAMYGEGWYGRWMFRYLWWKWYRRFP